MKTIKKTYAVRGLLEWHLLLHANGVDIPIRFSGGTMGSNGVIGGRYSTDNPVIQRLIESTSHFRRNRIYILRYP